MANRNTTPLGPAAPLVALLTDFGTAESSVGVMKAVMLGIAPGLPLVDLTHAVLPQDIAHGAWVLHTTWRYVPEASVLLCVVDPGVGSARRAVALRCGGRLFVGPDNGLFSYVLAAAPVEAACELNDAAFHARAPSPTFHGRDIFAPCAAYLARGVPLAQIGAPIAPASLVTLPLPRPEWQGDALTAHVLHMDHFGNLITDIGPELAERVYTADGAVLHIGGHPLHARARTFAAGSDVTPFLLIDSSGYLAIAVRGGSAAATLGVAVGAPLHVEGLRA